MINVGAGAKTSYFMVRGPNATMLSQLNKFSVYAPIIVTKSNHMQLQLRVSRQWFTRKTLLNTQHLKLMRRAILLDKKFSAMGYSGNIRSPNENTFVYTCIPMLASRIWPCYLHTNSTYFGLC